MPAAIGAQLRQLDPLRLVVAVVLALLTAYPVMRSQGRVSFAQWIVVVTVIAIVAVTTRLFSR